MNQEKLVMAFEPYVFVQILGVHAPQRQLSVLVNTRYAKKIQYLNVTFISRYLF